MKPKPKKIWILNHHAILPQYGGGTRHYDFACELVKRGYEVTVFSASHIHYSDINLLPKGEPWKELDVNGIKWVVVPTKSYHGNGVQRIIGMLQYYFRVLSVSKRYHAPEVIIGSAVHLLACLAAYKISLRNQARFISEIRDLWPETLIQMGSLKRHSLLAKGMNLLEDYVYRKSDKIIITAPEMRKYIETRGIGKGKIVNINNGVNVAQFDKNAQMSFPEDKDDLLEESCFNVVYAGGHGLANDLETLIKAAEIIKEKGFDDIRILLFGDGPHKSALMKMAHEKRLTNILFTDMLPKYCIPKILKKANALVFLGKRSELYQYGISANKLFEYLCAEVPIVFALESSNNYIEEAHCGITVEPENPAAVAEAIIKLYHVEAEERIEMGQNGRKFLENNFDISILVDRLEEVLTE